MQVAAEGPERAHWLLVSVTRHRDDMEGRADIDAGRIGVDSGEPPRCVPACFVTPWHARASCRSPRRAGVAPRITFLNGIA